MATQPSAISSLRQRLFAILESTHLGGLLYLQARETLDLGWRSALRFNRLRWHAWSQARSSARAYTPITARDLRSRRKSDTVFIFGSGYSLTEITPTEWGRISEHDTIGLNRFIHQSWIKVDYHFIRELESPSDRFSTEAWVDVAARYAEELERNVLFENTVLFIQKDFLGLAGNLLLGHKLIRPGRDIFLYRTYRGSRLPTGSFRKGIPRRVGAMGAGINIAYLAGWKRIVLIGVDLYDSRYFWLPADVSREGSPPVEATHPAANRGILHDMQRWREVLSSRGVDLTVYNPKSLLTEVMPVFAHKPTSR